MIEMLKETVHYPAFVAACIGGAIGLGLIIFGLAVKLYYRYFKRLITNGKKDYEKSTC